MVRRCQSFVFCLIAFGSLPTYADGQVSSDSHRPPEQVVTLGSDWTVGMVDGPDNYMFGEVRDMAVGETGIYVLDPLFKRIQVYDFSGNYARTIGREGWGPGEYQAPARLAVSNGYLVVHDLRKGRYLVFDTAGVALHTVAAEAQRSLLTRMHADTAGRLFDFRELPDAPSPAPFLIRIDLAERDAGPSDTIPLRRVERDGFMVRDRGFTGFYPQPFMADLHWAVLPDGIVAFADGSRAEVVLLGLDGTERTVRLTSVPVRISAIEKDRERQRVEDHLATLEYVGLDPKPYVRRLRMPDHYPPVLGLDSDPRGNIWVRIPHPHGMSNIRLHVLGRTGALIATYDILAGDSATLDEYRIGRDRIIVSTQEPDGTNRVRSYPLP